MKVELKRKLYEKYPDIFREHSLSPQVTAMCWGFDCDDGWYLLIDRLCLLLTTIEKETGCEIIAQQVKEKYAELRFYFYTRNTTMFDFEVIATLIDTFGCLSGKICEICGEPFGDLSMKGGWYKTLCTKHRNELGYVIYEDS